MFLCLFLFGALSVTQALFPPSLFAVKFWRLVPHVAFFTFDWVHMCLVCINCESLSNHHIISTPSCSRLSLVLSFCQCWFCQSFRLLLLHVIFLSKFLVFPVSPCSVLYWVLLWKFQIKQWKFLYINEHILQKTDTYHSWPRLNCPGSRCLHHRCMQGWCRCLYHTETALACNWIRLLWKKKKWHGVSRLHQQTFHCWIIGWGKI